MGDYCAYYSDVYWEFVRVWVLGWAEVRDGSEK